MQAQLNADPAQPGHLQLQTEVRETLTSATSTGTDPYRVTLYDQDGNKLKTGEIARGTGQLDRPTFGNNDPNPNSQYQNTECIQHVPRHNGEGSSAGSQGGGGQGGVGAGPSGPPPADQERIIRCGTTRVDDGERRRTCQRV